MSAPSAPVLAEMFNLHGKRGLILGIANEHSIATGCARAFAAMGAVHLVSDAARMITGTVIPVDGGQHLV